DLGDSDPYSLSIKDITRIDRRFWQRFFEVLPLDLSGAVQRIPVLRELAGTIPTALRDLRTWTHRPEETLASLAALCTVWAEVDPETPPEERLRDALNTFGASLR